MYAELLGNWLSEVFTIVGMLCVAGSLIYTAFKILMKWKE